MSNIYIQEPPTEGKVLLVTSAGEFDVELWSKEAPKACRNFIQLCMEGYYDGCIFHRVVPGFIVQGGDPTGTGTGGESIYGKTFKDEFHTRLRFVRRGLVAMANAGPNDNGSQFFFTLGACPELQSKHTIFGKIAGNTIYNISRFEEGEIGKDDRPEYPHKIISTEVLNNPFPGIEPRMSTKIVNEVIKESRNSRKKTKDFKLLSFGDQAEEEEEEVLQVTKKLTKKNKSNSAHDISMDPNLSAATEEEFEFREQELQRIREKLLKHKKLAEESETTLVSIPSETERLMEEKDKKRSEVRAEIKKLRKELHGDVQENISESCEQNPSKKAKVSSVLQQYNEDTIKYKNVMKNLPKKGSTRESQTLALLARFSKKVKDCQEVYEENSKSLENSTEEKDDESWITHRLQFNDEGPVMAKDASTKDDNWYDLNDPRNALNKRRREHKSKAVKS